MKYGVVFFPNYIYNKQDFAKMGVLCVKVVVEVKVQLLVLAVGWMGRLLRKKTKLMLYSVQLKLKEMFEMSMTM